MKRTKIIVLAVLAILMIACCIEVSYAVLNVNTNQTDTGTSSSSSTTHNAKTHQTTIIKSGATGHYTYCNTCKKKIGNTVSHSYNNYTTKATNKKDGKTEKKCSTCGYVASTTVHHWYEWNKVNDTNHNQKCVNCGTVASGSTGKHSPKSGTEKTSKSKVSTKTVCTKTQKTATCKTCGKSYVVSSSEDKTHSFTYTISKDKKTHTIGCSNCNYSQSGASHHKGYQMEKNNGDVHTLYCNQCKKSYGTEKHSFSGNKCKYCGYIKVNSIKLSKSSMDLEINKTANLSVSYDPTNTSSKDVDWKSDDLKVAKVTSTGTITAVGQGTTTITATSKANKKVKATCTVTVKPKSTIAISGKTEVEKGKKISLSSGNIKAKWSVKSKTSGGMGKVSPITNANKVEFEGTKEGSVLVYATADGYNQGQIEIAIKPASTAKPTPTPTPVPHNHDYQLTDTRYTTTDSNKHQKLETLVCQSKVGTCNAKRTTKSTTENHTRVYTSNGSKGHKITCSKCNAIISSNTAHTFGGWENGPSNATRSRKCTACGYVEVVKTTTPTPVPHNHDYQLTDTRYTTISSSQHQKLQTLVCQSKVGTCNAKRTTKSTTENHTRVYTSNGSKGHKITCSKCNAIISSNTAHTFGAWENGPSNATRSRKCTACGYVEVVKITTPTPVPKSDPNLKPLTTSVSMYVGESKKVTFTHKGNGVLTVGSNAIASGSISGKVLTITGKAVGTTTMKVNLSAFGNNNSATATVNVTVKPKTTVTVTVSPVNPTINVGKTQKLVAVLKPVGTKYTSLKWISETPSIATVNSSGVVTGVKAGSARIIATYETADGNKYSGSTTVTVKAVSNPNPTVNPVRPTSTPSPINPGLTVSDKTLEMYVGESKKATFTYSGSGKLSIEKVSSSDIIKTPTLTGKTVTVTGAKVGSTAITVKLSESGNYKSATAVINVRVKNKENPRLTPTNVTLEMYEGESKTVTYSYNGSGKLKIGSISPSGIAIATVNGKVVTVTGKKVGNTKITVELPENGNYAGASSIITVKVKAKATPTPTATPKPTVNPTATPKPTAQPTPTPVPTPDVIKVTDIMVEPDYKEIYPTDEFQLEVTVFPDDATNPNVTYSSSDTKIAQVTSSGKVIGIKEGKATITVKAKDGSGVVGTCEVVVLPTKSIEIPVEEIKVEPEEKVIKPKDTFSLKVTVTPSNATNKKVTYISDDPDVATVNESGKVTGIAPGIATISVIADDGYGAVGYCTVIVEDNTPVPTEVTINAKYNGKDLLKDYEDNEIPVNSPIEVTFTPSDKITRKTFEWDGDDETPFTGSSITVPNFEPDSWHTLTIRAYEGDELVGQEVYLIHIPANPDDPTPDDPTPDDPTPEVTITVDAFAKYNDVELAKLSENPTELSKGANIAISAVSNPSDKVTSITYYWEDGTSGTINGASGNIQVPNTFVEGATYVLYLQPYVDDVPYSEKEYHIRIPTDFQVNALYNGENIDDGFRGEGNLGDPITLYADPADEVASITYVWDNKAGDWTTESNPEIELHIPEEFKPGETHILYAYATGNNGKISVVKSYTFVIPNPDSSDDPFEVLPWEEENHDFEGIYISLRNDSEETSKANKNMYALNDSINYYIDFKNAGEDITEPVTITFNIPLEFEVIDNGGGEVNQSARTITWTYPNGMVEGYSGTKKVVLRYTSLSKSSLTAETIYPLATIAVDGDVKDKSAVVNLIYLDNDTVIDIMHSPYMYGDANATTFRPDDTITRAEGALVLGRILLGQDTINSTNVNGAFPDLNETYLEAQKAITACTSYGIINGYTDGTYKPNRTMTRAEFMKILATYLSINSKEKGIEGLELKSVDNSAKVYNNPVSEYIVNGEVVTSHWAIPEISLLTRINMTPVSEDERDLRIDKSIMRAEVAQLVNYYLLRAPASYDDDTYTGFSDVSTEHKLVGDILEATRNKHNFRITSDALEIAE